MTTNGNRRGIDGRRPKWIAGLGAAALAVGLSTLGLPAAQAVHDTGAFELDGNATSTTADDWDRVCHQVNPTACPTPNQSTNGATAVDWTAEANLNSSIFTGGGSKDPQDINQWAWKDGAGGLPDKDNLLHAFAARYSLTPSAHCPSGGADTCDVIFFGSDRYDNSGDAQQGFWFLQNKVTLGSKAVGGGTSFNGVHKNGDVLVVSDFSVGGTTSIINVYSWNSACTKAGVKVGQQTCSDVNLLFLSGSTSATCGLSDADGFCGIVNGSGVTAPWSFTDKSGTPNNGYLPGELYEAGVNLSTLGLSGECFASVVSETRSSTSTTATLKDFVLGGFGDCTSHITTVAKDGSGNDLTLGNLSIGSGSVTAKDQATVTVAGSSSWSGTVQFYLCGTNATSCDTSGTAIGDPVNVSHDVPTVTSPQATITSAGNYCWHAAFTASSSQIPSSEDTGTNECFTVSPVDPTLATSAVSTAKVGDALSDTATLTDTATGPATPAFYPTGASNVSAGAAAGGTITFKLYGPSTTSCGALVWTSSAQNVGDLSPSGRGATITTDSTVNITQPGTYHWVASYSGDSPNTNSATHNTDCTDSNEDVVVSPYQPTIGTAQKWLPNDSATITVGGGGKLNGTVNFELYNSATCSGTAAYTKNVTVTDATSGSTFSTDNSTVFVTASGSWSWRVRYQSSNAGQRSIDWSCQEVTALTVANGTTWNTPPSG